MRMSRRHLNSPRRHRRPSPGIDVDRHHNRGRPGWYSPANAYAERWGRTVWSEVTDQMLIVVRRHPRTVLDGYVAHHNQHRPRRALKLRPPLGSEIGAVAQRARPGGWACPWEPC